MTIDFSAAAAAATTDPRGQEAAERLLRAAQDLDASQAASREAKAALLTQAAELIEGAVSAASSITAPGGGGLLALAAGPATGVPSGAPDPGAAPAAPVTDLRVDALASSLGMSADEALRLVEQIGQALNAPDPGAAPVRARAMVANDACRGSVSLREDLSPRGSVLPDGFVSSGPAPAALGGTTGPTQADLDALKRERDQAVIDLASMTADRDASARRVTALEAAKTALRAAQAMPGRTRADKAARNAALDAALQQLSAA